MAIRFPVLFALAMTAIGTSVSSSQVTDEIVDLMGAKKTLTQAIPIRQQQEGAHFQENVIGTSSFCTQGVVGQSNSRFDGIRITDGYSIAFLIDEDTATQERINDREKELIMAWVSFRITLHNYLIDGEAHEEETNLQLPDDWRQNIFTGGSKMLPCEF